MKDMPNLLIAGSKCVVHPVAVLPDGHGRSLPQAVPFLTDDCLLATVTLAGETEIGFGFGLAAMISALERLMLPDFDWTSLVRDVLRPS